MNNQSLYTCDNCAITHFLKDIPMLMKRKGMPIVNTPSRQNDTGPQKQNAPQSSTQSPPKRQILPQSTTNLLKTQVLELQADNAKLQQAKGASLQMPSATELKLQETYEMKGQEEATVFHKANSDTDGIDDTCKEQVAQCNKELSGGQRKETTKKDSTTSRQPQQANE